MSFDSYAIAEFQTKPKFVYSALNIWYIVQKYKYIDIEISGETCCQS